MGSSHYWRWLYYILINWSAVFEAPLFVAQEVYVLEIGQVLSRVLAVLGVVLALSSHYSYDRGMGCTYRGVYCSSQAAMIIPAALRALPQLRLNVSHAERP